MATYDIDALKADLPTAKELAQFVYDKTGIALDLVGKPKEDQYQVAKNALEGKKIPSDFLTDENPYVEKKDKEAVKRNFKIIKLINDKIEQLVEQENTGAEKAKLFPTDLGLVVTDFLNQHFTNVMDYSFTANIEKEDSFLLSPKNKRTTAAKNVINNAIMIKLLLLQKPK